MPLCLRQGYAGNTNPGATGAVNYLLNDAGNANATPATLAVFLLPDTVTQDVSNCQAVALSGAEYQAIQLAISNHAPADGGVSDVGVSSNVFMGAALVAIVAIGWIAGAQR